MENQPRAPDADDHLLRALMGAYQDGDLDAFDRLYTSLEGEVRRFFAGRCYDRQRVEDLVQETFLQIHRSRRGYRRELPVRPWVFAIANRVFLMYLRTVKRRESPEVALGDSGVNQSASSGDAITTGVVLRDALRQVPADGRRAFLLHHWRGLTFREIADKLHVEAGAVKLRSSRTARRLRELLKDTPGDPHD